MNLQSVIADLKKERDRVDRAIAALDEIASNGGPAGRDRRARSKGVATARSSTKRHLTAAGRKRLSDLMKRRWAERRKKGTNGRKGASKAA